MVKFCRSDHADTCAKKADYENREGTIFMKTTIKTLFVTAMALLTGYGCTAGLWPRPQEPKERPYRIETVRFPGGEGSVQLEGELTMPYGDGPFPAVVFITGSGPQDRNEKVAGHKPFLVLSDYLTRRGFAVLRYDDRGFGKSTGEYFKATPDDFAADAAAAFALLQHHPGVDGTQIGFLGHSEGGYIAPLAARRVIDAAFMIFLAGPAKPLLSVMKDQVRDLLQSIGASETVIAKGTQQFIKLMEILRTTDNTEEAKIQLKAYLKKEGVSTLTGKKLSWFEFYEGVRLWASPWGKWYAAGYDPLPALKSFNRPVLALFGGTDLQVSAKENAPIMASALMHPKSEVCVLLGLNHLFQPSESGKVEEYAKIKTTIDERALRKIGDWLETVTTPSPASDIEQK